MKEALVYNNGVFAGKLIQTDQREYVFRYEEGYFRDGSRSAISLTFPKTQQEYRSQVLFPFFYNMLAEGVNRTLQARQLQVDENDSFSLLLGTAGTDTIGAITIKPVMNES